MDETEREIDWSLTTWEGSRRAQLRHALSLTLRERLEAAEGLADMSRQFSQMRGDSGALPSYAEEFLAGLGPEALVGLMEHDEDRVPRAVIDACARHGDVMTTVLEPLLEQTWTACETDGAWWLRVHAAMILGLIPSGRAGMLLARYMRLMSENEDEDLQDWLAGYWPAFFANKPDAVPPELEAIWGDGKLDWYVRANVLDPIVAAAQRRSAAALDYVLVGLARLAGDEEVEWDTRMSCALMLIAFPREAHRKLLEELASRQSASDMYFGRTEVDDAFASGRDDPEWAHRNDPWSFYRPEEIAARQERWAEEADEEEEDDLFGEALASTYVRLEPKVGRNDPCPCGSGKKYKKCCLPG